MLYVRTRTFARVSFFAILKEAPGVVSHRALLSGMPHGVRRHGSNGLLRPAGARSSGGLYKAKSPYFVARRRQATEKTLMDERTGVRGFHKPKKRGFYVVPADTARSFRTRANVRIFLPSLRDVAAPMQVEEAVSVLEHRKRSRGIDSEPSWEALPRIVITVSSTATGLHLVSCGSRSVSRIVKS